MKKNKMMRVASVLLIAVLMTTCAISGTFAKYTTEATASDTARVAKWGVKVETWDKDTDTSVFAKEYDSSVESSVSTEMVVAPGTKNDSGVSFKIEGQPEVDVQVTFTMTVTNDVVVPAGDYLDYTTGNDSDDTFTLADDYTPVVFTLTNDGAPVATGTLDDIEAYLEGTTMTKAHNANDNLSDIYGTYTLTWAWVFDGNDKADTLLGNVAAGTHTDANIDTEIDFEIVINVTQID